MISVVIAVRDQEFALARTLAALVPAAAEGFVRDVVVVDGGSSDGTLVVADAAGCAVVEGDFVEGLKAARSDWVLVIPPGLRLDADWSREAAAFLQRASASGDPHRAATFRHGSDAFGPRARLAEWLGGLRQLYGRPRTVLAPRQALIAGERLRATRLRARAFAPGKADAPQG